MESNQQHRKIYAKGYFDGLSAGKVGAVAATAERIGVVMLTPAIKSVYAVPTAATSAVGFGDLNYETGVHTPQALVGVFLCSQESPFMAVCVGNYPQGLVAGCRFARFANLTHAVTTFWRGWCQRFDNSFEPVNTMNTLFILRTDASASDVRDEIHSLNEQALALIDSIITLTATRDCFDTLPAFIHYDHLIAALLRTVQLQNLLCERGYRFKIDDPLNQGMESSV